MSKNQSEIAFWDRLGISISGLCAIHCLFFPIALSLLPLWPVAESIHDWTHPILFILIVPTVIFALRGKGLSNGIAVYLILGLAVVGSAWMLHDYLLGDWAEAGITMAGSALLVRGHWLNYVGHKSKYKAGQYEAT